MNDNLTNAVCHLRGAMSKAQSHLRAHPEHENMPKALQEIVRAVEYIIREISGEKPAAKEPPAENLESTDSHRLNLIPRPDAV
jgi:hypothetical protein